MMARKKKPSRAVATGTVAGGGLTPLVLWGLSAAGVPLPGDPVAAAQLGAAAAGVLAGVVGFFTRGGRQGEAD